MTKEVIYLDATSKSIEGSRDANVKGGVTAIKELGSHLTRKIRTVK